MAIPTYKAPKLPADMQLDGNFNKAVWGNAPIIDYVNTVDGKAPKQKTEAKFGWTDTHLWAAFHAEDTCIQAELKEHDHPNLWSENVVEIFFDPMGTGRIYYEFQVNCHNTTFDGIVHLASGAGPQKGIACYTDWNPESLKSKVTGKGKFNGSADKDEFWDTELCVAFEDLWMIKDAPRPGTQYRFNTFRVDTSNSEQELYAWNPTMLPQFHVSELFGIMELAD